MKKLFLALTVLALSLCLATAAVAAGPKSACFKIGGYATTLHLTFKSLGTLKTSAGNVKFYSVFGEVVDGDASFLLSGTAHIQPGTSIVHFSVEGFTDKAGHYSSSQLEGFWDTSLASTPFPQNVGTINWRFFYGGATGYNNGTAYTLNSADCSLGALPYDEPSLLSTVNK